MIDSVLKGTGNSRFLKSAVPAGISWADALAMLQAGTFPIDFNGINTEGFQQVGTPLNKANLLKDATAAQIGLPPSTTPDGMFQALGNTGELHVWRKTVVNASTKLAGYTLGSGTNLTLVKSTQRYGQGSTYWVPAASISVNDGGAINEITGSSVQVYYEKEESELKSAFWGKFIKFSSESDYGNVPDKDGVWFIPNSATIQKTTGGNYYFLTVVGAQKVNPYPLTPAGTTTTYPVSTNPNAYQEGDDAKEAGYTLGNAVTGEYYLGNANVGYVMSYKTATSLSVSDNGILSMPTDATSFNVTYSKNGLTTDQIKSYFAGKFVQLVAVGSTSVFSPSSLFETAPSEILFIPSNSVVTKDEFKNFNIDRYQPVTGYAAIPAGTTIEYLGKLGDKARVQVVSYVGTGTYGSGHPNSLTFDFVPKVVFVVGTQYSDGDGISIMPMIYGYGFSNRELSDSNANYCIVTWNKKNVTWYAYSSNAVSQSNSQGGKYFAVAIG